MTLAELFDGQTVKYRIGRAGDGDATGPSWRPWTTGTLFCNRRDKDLPERMRPRCAYWRGGDITGLTIRDDATVQGWAEYTQADYCGDGTFVAEDYYLEIEGLV